MPNPKGFTLIEVLIVVAIVAILATIAYPSYTHHVQQTRRTEAQKELIRIANLQERYFLNNDQYATLSDLGLVTAPATTYNTENAYYQISLPVRNVANSTYILTATAINAQAADTACASLSINQSGTKTATNNYCWQ